MKDKFNLEKEFPILGKVIEKTIGFDMGCGVKAMTEEESWEWHKKHARIDPNTCNMIISSDEIGDGSYEKKYKKPYKRN